jgi:serine/threonine protein kinase
LYAIKRIQLIKNTGVDQKRIEHEIDILARSNCPHIVRYYRWWDEHAEFNCQVSFLFDFYDFLEHFDLFSETRRRRETNQRT